MKSKKESFWFITRPLVLMTVALTGIIIMIHAATTKPKKAEVSCSSSCKKLNADILNAVTVKFM
jgi:hypothetical protein